MMNDVYLTPTAGLPELKLKAFNQLSSSVRTMDSAPYQLSCYVSAGFVLLLGLAIRQPEGNTASSLVELVVGTLALSTEATRKVLHRQYRQQGNETMAGLIHIYNPKSYESKEMQ